MKKTAYRNIRESAESHTIELIYDAHFNLYCPDFPNEKWIQTEDYRFWDSVEKNCRGLVRSANDLTEYLPENLKEKVTSVKLNLDENNSLHVVCALTVPEEDVKDELIDWANEQMSDGWGENFEQEELGTTEMFVCYDENDAAPDVDFCETERNAKNYCEDMNEQYYENEKSPNFIYYPVEVYATCSFWKNGVKASIADPSSGMRESKAKRIKEAAISWDDFDKFNSIEKRYLPSTGQGTNMMNQICTAVSKIIFRWYNDGDVVDNVSTGLEGWANDLSSYGNWLQCYVPEATAALRDILYNTNGSEEKYEQYLYNLAETLLNEKIARKYEQKDKIGDIYSCTDGDFVFEESKDEDWENEEEYDWGFEDEDEE